MSSPFLPRKTHATLLRKHAARSSNVSNLNQRIHGLAQSTPDLPINHCFQVVQIREVEGDDDGEGELFATLQIGDRTVIRGMKFLDRMADLGPRSIHVTAILAAGTTTLIFPAQYFAAYGRVVFKLDNQQLGVEPEEMSGIRRMRPVRFLSCV